MGRKLENKFVMRILLLILALALSVPVSSSVQAAVQNGWNSSKTVYYKNGTRYSGPITIEGKNYYLLRGRKQTGFQTYGDPEKTYYYKKKTGVMVTGLKRINKKYYYFEPDTGAMYKGWLITSGKKYFFKKNGQMKTGALSRKGLVYWFNKKGVLTRTYTKEQYLKLKEKKTGKLTAASLSGLSPEEVIAKIGPLFTADQKKSGVLACISMAQFLLESGYGQSELAQKANNCFGMKEILSGNTWPGTSWNGTSVYTKKTYEYDSSGNPYPITAKFRKYSCIEDSIADHSAYLTNAIGDYDTLRYLGLKNCKNYTKAAKIILKGGYATSSSYVAQLCELITRWNLTQYNA